MENETNIATVAAPVSSTEATSSHADKQSALMLRLQHAITEQEEDVKKKLTAVKPAKNLRPGKVDEAKARILDTLPQAPAGYRIDFIHKGVPAVNKDECEQALNELVTTRIVGQCGPFYFRHKIR